MLYHHHLRADPPIAVQTVGPGIHRRPDIQQPHGLISICHTSSLGAEVYQSWLPTGLKSHTAPTTSAMAPHRADIPHSPHSLSELAPHKAVVSGDAAFVAKISVSVKLI